MPDVDKYHGKGFDMNFNLLLFMLIIITFVGNYWMVANDIPVGNIYYFMVLGGLVGAFVITQIFFRGDELKDVNKFVKAPFTTSLFLACISYLAGWLLPAIIETVLWIFRKAIGITWSITSFSIPLFAGGGEPFGIKQSFSAVAFSENMAWKIFNVSFNAGATEEIVFTFGLMLLGSIVGIFLLRFWFKGKAPFLSNENFVLITGITFSVLLFTGAHLLNSTYIGYMFIIAGLFKLISLVSIYYWGLFLTFWIGYHQSNNFIYLIQTDGLVAVANGFVSWFGIFFIVWFLSIFLFIIQNWSYKELKAYIKS